MKVTHVNTFLNTGYPIILQILARYLDIYIYTHTILTNWMIRPHECPPVVNSASWSNCRDVFGLGNAPCPAPRVGQTPLVASRVAMNHEQGGSGTKTDRDVSCGCRKTEKPNIFFIHFASSTRPPPRGPGPGAPLAPSLGSPSAPYASHVSPKKEKV